MSNEQENDNNNHGYVLFDYEGVEGYNNNNVLGQRIVKKRPISKKRRNRQKKRRRSIQYTNDPSSLFCSKLLGSKEGAEPMRRRD